MPAESEAEGLQFNEDTEESWIGYLRQFKEDVYPVFEPYGFTLPEAFAIWSQNKLHNVIADILRETHGD